MSNEVQKPLQKAPLPEGHIAINPEDKPLIREAGKALEKFFLDFADSHGGVLEIKTMLGAIDYAVLKYQERSKLIVTNAVESYNQDYVKSVNRVQELGLATQIVEPFADVVEPDPAPNPASLPPTDTNKIADTTEPRPSPYPQGGEADAQGGVAA